jgi:hypothetical protein
MWNNAKTMFKLFGEFGKLNNKGNNSSNTSTTAASSNNTSSDKTYQNSEPRFFI